MQLLYSVIGLNEDFLSNVLLVLMGSLAWIDVEQPIDYNYCSIFNCLLNFE